METIGVRRKFNGGVHSVACGGHLYLVYVVCDVTIWRHIHVSKQCFGEVRWHNMYIIPHALPYFMCHCTEYKLSTLQVRISEENKLNATTQQVITTKISSCALKQGSKTHSSLRRSNLHLHNEAALMSCRFRAMEHRRCATGLADAHPRFARSNLAKLHKTTLDFLLCTQVQQTLSFPFSLLRHYQMPEYFFVKNCCFWARATVLSRYGNW